MCFILFRALTALVSGLRLSSVICLIAFFPVAPGNKTLAQGKRTPENSIPDLIVGRPVERNLAAGQKHTYSIDLKIGEYVELVVTQQGVDVVVTVDSPDRQRLLRVDGPTGAEGPEEAFLIAEKNGKYFLNVEPLEENTSGNYSVILKEKHPPTEQNRKKINDLNELERAQQIENQWSVLYRNGQFSEAIPLAETVLAIREKVLGRDNDTVAITLNSLAMLYKDNGEFGRAEELLKESLAIDTKRYGADHPNLAIAYGNLATLYFDTGDYGQAKTITLKALELRKKAFGDDHPDVALTLHNLARIQEAGGDLVGAEQTGKQVLAIYKKIAPADHPHIARSLDQLAEVYRLRGDFVRAEPLYLEAIAIYKKNLGEKHISLATPMSNLAVLYQQKREYEKALRLYIDIVEIYQAVLKKDHPLIAQLLDNVANLYSSLNDYDKAETFALHALSIRLKTFGENSPETAYSYNTLSSIYEKKGKYAEAEKLLQKTLAIWVKSLGENHPTVATVCSNLALLYFSTNDIPQAIKFARRMNDIEEYNLKLILSVGSENQKRVYLEKISGSSDFIISLNTGYSKNNVEATEMAATRILQNKGRLLETITSQIEQIRRRTDLNGRNTLERITAVRSRLANLVISNSNRLSYEKRLAEISKLEREAEQLEGSLETTNAEFRPVSLKAVQQALPVQSTLLEFISYRYFDTKAQKITGLRYAVYVIGGPSSTPQVIDLGDSEAVDRDIASWRKALGDPSSKNVRILGRSLDEKIMRPVRRLLGSVRQLFVSPDSALNLIPFAALVDENGKYLVENYSINYLSSGRDLLRLRDKSSNKNAPLVIADPLYNATTAMVSTGNKTQDRPRSTDFTSFNYPSLPGTAAEAKLIQRLLPDAIILQGQEATEEAVKKFSAPRILHIATHGFFLPVRETGNAENQLLRSGLVLAGVSQMQSGEGEDGILTALEVAGMDLWGTKLVVLSACETGVGDIQNWEGLYGLRRALVLAGSESQVLSLWKVSDQATRDLMGDYYSKLQAKKGRSEGLREAQLEMLHGASKRKKFLDRGRGVEIFSDGKQNAELLFKYDSRLPYSHPYFWAGFIHSGAWSGITDTGQ